MDAPKYFKVFPQDTLQLMAATIPILPMVGIIFTVPTMMGLNGITRRWIRHPELVLFASIALDTSGKVHISYFDEINGDLKYATTNSSGSWVTTTVDVKVDG
ncbi:MAG: hypothetical protein U0586_09935 [Candidatus Brocadiaceae bacterium]